MTAQARILIADDDQAAAMSISRVLQHRNYAVDVAHSGAALRELEASRSDADLLIADIYMPGNVDLELLQWEPVRSGRLPLILVTGQPTLATAVRALRMSVVDYVAKPIDPPYLLMRVAEALQRRRAEREAAAATGEIARLLGVLSGRFGPASDQAHAAADPGPERCLDGLPQAQRDALSGRERQVVIALTRHGSLAAVSRVLSISPHTVRGHLASIFRKLQVNSQVELIAKLMGSDVS